MLSTRGHHHSFSESEAKRVDTNLRRSASSLSLKPDPGAQQDKVTILTQLFWIAVALLESDYDYEFLLAVKLLSKVINFPQGFYVFINKLKWHALKACLLVCS